MPDGRKKDRIFRENFAVFEEKKLFARYFTRNYIYLCDCSMQRMYAARTPPHTEATELSCL